MDLETFVSGTKAVKTVLFLNTWECDECMS